MNIIFFATVILTIVTFNLVPLTPRGKEIFGHYLTYKITYKINGFKNTNNEYVLTNSPFVESIKVPCNSWLMWWQSITHLPLVRIEKPKVEIEFENADIERIWEELKG